MNNMRVPYVVLSDRGKVKMPQREFDVSPPGPRSTATTGAVSNYCHVQLFREHPRCGESHGGRRKGGSRGREGQTENLAVPKRECRRGEGSSAGRYAAGVCSGEMDDYIIVRRGLVQGRVCGSNHYTSSNESAFVVLICAVISLSSSCPLLCAGEA